MDKLIRIIIFLAFIIVLVLPHSALAVETPGVKPGTFFYGFTTAFEKINLFFTFSLEKRPRKR